MNRINLPIVSIIIVTYNHKNFFMQSIESVLLQETQYKYEIIIADDCSNDGTLELINKVAIANDKIKLLIQERNVGTTKNLCDAFEISNGKYLILLAGDDYWCDMNLIEKQVNWLENHVEYLGVSHTYAILRGDRLKSNCINKRLLNKDHSTELYLKGNGFLTHSTMFANIFIGAERFKYYEHIQSDRLIEDISLSMILLDKGKFRILPGDVAVYRVRKDGNNYNSLKGIIDSYQDHINNLVANDTYFDGKYDFSQMISMRITIAIIKSIMSGNFSLIPKILKFVKEKYRKKWYFRFPIDILILFRYRILGHF